MKIETRAGSVLDQSADAVVIGVGPGRTLER